MSVLKSIFVVVVGLLMFAAYLCMLVAFTKFANYVLPSLAFLLFLAFAVASALAFIKLQTHIERILIRRHVAQNPRSSWRHVAAK